MEVLRGALATQPVEEFFTLTPTDNGDCNIIHLAVLSLQEEFLRELITKLPSSAVHFLISQQDNTKYEINALHYAVLRGNVEILRVLLDFYCSVPSLEEGMSLQKPWLSVDDKGKTPLLAALQRGNKDCALEIMSMDMELLCNMVDDKGTSPLVEAVRRGSLKVAVKILTSGCSYSTSGDDGLTPLDVAPNSTEEVCTLLLNKHPEMIKKSDQFGYTLLHKWVLIGRIWPICLLLNRVKQTSASRKDFIDLLCATCVAGNNPLHVAANLFDDDHVVKLLIETYIEAYEKEKGEVLQLSPWLRENQNRVAPLIMALLNKRDELALYLLSLDLESLVLYSSESALYCAVCKGCDRAVEKILTSIDPLTFRYKSRLIRNLGGRGENVLHAASCCTERTANLLLDKLAWLINEPDENGKRPIDSASEIGASWLIELLIKKDPILNQ